ncbi:MAG: mechanosensitive ion channel family protein [Deltaproteobacteria bacterium]|nr:mechanosensitive ion channel family protein [Deltaproteobacteria bacterium]
MWELFMANGVWILLAVVVGFVLFFLFRHWAFRWVQKLFPKQGQEQLEGTRRALTWVIIGIGGVILALAVAAVVVSRYGVDVTPALDMVGDWLLEHGVPIFAIILVSWFIYKILGVIMPILVRRYVTTKGKKRRTQAYITQRSQSLGKVVTQALGIFLVIIAFFMILSELGLDITPLLASAGVAGIAIGFAAQNSIRDLIGGFMIMLEDHYNVGDVVKVADITGEVTELGLRRTVLRDLKGILHVIPNGEIRVASNYTRSISRVFFEVGVAYKEDLDRVMDVIRRVWEEMAEHPDWGPQFISKTPWLLRVEEFGDSGIVIRAVGDTKPMAQWSIMGELRRRVKRAFDEENIEIPWPHVKLYMGDKPADGEVTSKPAPKPTPKPTSRPAPRAKRGKGHGEGFGDGSGEGGY